MAALLFVSVNQGFDPAFTLAQHAPWVERAWAFPRLIGIVVIAIGSRYLWTGPGLAALAFPGMTPCARRN